MMKIERIKSYEELHKLIELLTNAYPLAIQSGESEMDKLVKNLEKSLELRTDIHISAVKDDAKTIGCMRYHDFQMQFLGKKVLTGGVGMVAVDLLNKKKGIAKMILTDFLTHYKEEGALFTALYPFRPDFYKQMGFGFGKSLNQYRISPRDFPKGHGKENCVYLTDKDIPSILESYHRYQEETNGLFDKYEDEFKKEMDKGHRFIGFRQNNKLTGYFSFSFEKTSDRNVMTQDMRVHEILFEDVETLMAFSGFFNSQLDQVERVIINIQDQDFQFLFNDPRNDSQHNMAPHFQECSTQGTGVMYRLIDNKLFFETYKNHNFGNQTLKVTFDIEDDFFKENNGAIKVAFNEGIPTLLNNSDITDVIISMSVANFSSLLTGCVSYKSLLRYGQTELSNSSAVESVNRLFIGIDAALCMTRF